MNKPLISVITPVYNGEKYIYESVMSIKAQTFCDFEHIVIDDCSSDKTIDILKKITNYPQFKIITLKKHLGLPLIRNYGIQKPQGNYIVWQDADDISDPHRLKILYEYMENYPKIGICGSGIEFFGETNKSFRNYFQKDINIRKNMFKFSPISQPSAIIRKNALDKVGMFDKKWKTAEDLDLSFRIGEEFKFANIKAPLLKYRLHKKSVTFTDLKQTEIRTFKIRYKYRNSKSYKIKLSDWIFNILQMLTMYLMTPNFRIKLFNYLRNSR